MTSLLSRLGEMCADAFAAEGLDRAFGQVKVSDRPDLAQFQCNGALTASKQAKRPPRAIAESVVERLSAHPIFAKIEIAGPGFINLTLTDAALEDHLRGMTADRDRLGVPLYEDGRKILLDYGGPNVAKPMHVGHLRSSIIGDTLRRILTFAGAEALGDIHIGDWGTQMGMIIAELARRHPEWPYFDAAANGPYPSDSPVTLADLEEVYPAASKACKEDPERMEEARRATLELQQGRPGYRALWRHFVDVSLATVKRDFGALGVEFQIWKGESDADPAIPAMTARLIQDGWAVESDGALVVPVARNDDTKEVPPLILRKSDGAVLYGTTDLATIVQRQADEHPDEIVYVVDQRQGLHFEQVFRAARLSGIVGEDRPRLRHAGFGTMNGPDGKPFKTRAGGVMKLEDLIAMATDKARQRLAEADIASDFAESEREDIARKVAIAAIKYADLQNHRESDYIFDLDRFMQFEGRTGPYLLYQVVRISSLLTKADWAKTAPVTLRDADRPLALLLTELPEVLRGTIHNLAPHILCDYAYRLAGAFSSFYGACHILSEPDEALKESRLTLCALTRDQLRLILSLLGIEVPARM